MESCGTERAAHVIEISCALYIHQGVMRSSCFTRSMMPFWTRILHAHHTNEEGEGAFTPGLIKQDLSCPYLLGLQMETTEHES